MTSARSIPLILSILLSSILWINALALAHVPVHLQHDILVAHEAFEKRCTKCHSMNTALSSRAYRDWLSGITQRHGKGSDWIPDEDARQIFLHLIVHLEPQFKTAVQAPRFEPKENWKILICLISGFSTLTLLIVTVVFGHNKVLRRKWFKGHSYFARATLIAAIIHGGYCFYMFSLD
jgi:hypothetical protein